MSDDKKSELSIHAPQRIHDKIERRADELDLSTTEFVIKAIDENEEITKVREEERRVREEQRRHYEKQLDQRNQRIRELQEAVDVDSISFISTGRSAGRVKDVLSRPLRSLY